MFTMKKMGAHFLCLGMVVFISACDPEGPGATGNVYLGEGIQSDGYLTLEIRVFPDQNDALNLSDPSQGDGFGVSISHDNVTFPYNYRVGETIGSTDFQNWRVVAWLAKTSDNQWIQSGEHYGTTRFEVQKCGGGGGNVDDFCGKTEDVDIIIDQLSN
jgi:hypothetical protein